MQNYFETINLPCFAAEFDYFRIAQEKWELYLTRLAQMGIKFISIPVPWGFHEFDEGTIDLNGATNPRRDLARLVELCAVLDLACILKPGPYSGENILNDGLPVWLTKKSDPGSEMPPAAVENWYKAVSNTLQAQQWPDGPIVLVWLNDRPADRQPAYSQELTEVRWPIWLRKRYQGIAALNAAYGATYRTISDVEFPQAWSQEATPLEKDAKTFLEEVQHDRRQGYLQALVEAGWQIPVHLPANEPATLPEVKDHSLAAGDEDILSDLGQSILVLHHSIEIEPDPVDVGTGPMRAGQAPIRADGSVRRKFWQIRNQIWQRSIPTVQLDGEVLTLTVELGGIVTCGQDTTVKVSLEKGVKPAAYRLYLSGALAADEGLKAARGSLSGRYLTEDGAGQTDLVIFLNNPAEPLQDFILAYLQKLLKAQAHALARCAVLAANLGDMLAPDQADFEPTGPAHVAPASYTLAEARRGLREADEILRRAVSSIGGLETGFGTILGHSRQEPPEPAPAPVPIHPDIFEGAGKDVLIEAGAICRDIVPELRATAEALQEIAGSGAGFTLEAYRQSYERSVKTAESCRERLLQVIGRLRLEIAAKTLPLVAWRVHDQVQSVAERLRWGVLRDS